jgi:hypothetical protein
VSIEISDEKDEILHGLLSRRSILGMGSAASAEAGVWVQFFKPEEVFYA